MDNMFNIEESLGDGFDVGLVEDAFAMLGAEEEGDEGEPQDDELDDENENEDEDPEEDPDGKGKVSKRAKSQHDNKAMEKILIEIIKHKMEPHPSRSELVHRNSERSVMGRFNRLKNSFEAFVHNLPSKITDHPTRNFPQFIRLFEDFTLELFNEAWRELLHDFVRALPFRGGRGNGLSLPEIMGRLGQIHGQSSRRRERSESGGRARKIVLWFLKKLYVMVLTTNSRGRERKYLQPMPGYYHRRMDDKPIPRNWLTSSFKHLGFYR